MPHNHNLLSGSVRLSFFSKCSKNPMTLIFCKLESSTSVPAETWLTVYRRPLVWARSDAKPMLCPYRRQRCGYNVTLRAGNVSSAFLLRKSNSDDAGFSIKFGSRHIWCLGKKIGSIENCLNVTIVSSFVSPTLWVFATRARPPEAQL